MAYGGGAKGGASKGSRGGGPDHGGYGGPGDSSVGGASAGAGHSGGGYGSGSDSEGSYGGPGGYGGWGGPSSYGGPGGYGGWGGPSSYGGLGSIGGLGGAVQRGIGDIGDWGLAFGTDKDFKDPSDAIGEALRSYHANPHALAPDSLAKAYDLGLVDVTGRLAPEARDYHLSDATMFGMDHPTKPGVRQANIRDIPLTTAQTIVSAIPSLFGLGILGVGMRHHARAQNYNEARQHFPGLPEIDYINMPYDPGDGEIRRPAPTTPPAPPAPTPSKWNVVHKRLYESLHGKTDGDQSILSLYRKMFAEEDE